MTSDSARPAPDPIDLYVGQRVRERRRALGLSQTELGKLLSVSFQQVQKYEKGTNRIAASTLYKIAQQFGVGVWWFYEGLPPTAPMSGSMLLDAINDFEGAAARVVGLVRVSAAQERAL